MNFLEFFEKLKYKRDKIFICILPLRKMQRLDVDIFCKKHGIKFLDYREIVIRDTRFGQQQGMITLENEIQRIQNICKENKDMPILLYNMDLIISYFDFDTRKLFWSNAYSRMPHLSAVPGIPLCEDSSLLPENFGMWADDGRVFK